MLEGDHAGPRRLPFSFEAKGGVGRLALEGREIEFTVGPLVVDRLELEVTDLGTDPASAVAERFQRRRTRLRALAIHVSSSALDERVEQLRRPLAGLGITQLSARLNDGFVSVRARAADGLAAADVSFRIQIVSAGTQLRALASTIRVHGHLPTPGPVIVDRILVAMLGATDAAGVVERPHVRGLCDVEIDLVGALLWHVLPPAGWRLPSVGDLELVRITIARGALEVVYGPAGTRTGELGVRPQTHQLAAAHDLMLSADTQLREGHFEDAMRGYRALLASGGPEQPLLLERLLALAAARPAWFFDGLELSRQALGRWPNFPPSHAALASITLAQGDARIAAEHLTALAQLASAEGDDDQAALSALAGARLLRVLDPRAATQLYQLALEHDASSSEAADALADRFADEQRWPELVRLVRARAVITPDLGRAVQLRLRLADVFVHHLDDPHSAQQELAVARHLAPDDPAVHEMTATILSTIDPVAAIAAWQDVARLAEARGDHRTTARALAIVGDKLVHIGAGAHEAEAAWTRALELDPLQADAIAGLAYAAAAREDHATAADYLERLRGIGLPPQVSARHELALARSLVAIGRTDDARASLRRATLAGGETAAEAHAVLAEVAEASDDRDHAATELDTAIGQLLDLASHASLTDPTSERMYTRAAELAMARASLFDRSGQASAASGEWMRAHELAVRHAPQIARSAARTMLARSGDTGTERQWIDAVLATRPPPAERAQLLVRRAAARRDERAPDMAAALADLHEALRICEGMASNQDGTDPEATEIRRRAYQLEAELLAKSGDQRARAQALAALAKMAAREDRVESETAAAAAWLAADEPAAALPHGARAHAALEPEVPSRIRRDVLLTLGEAAWRQRAWPDVMRAYRGLIDEPNIDTVTAPRLGVYRYRLAVAADRTGDAAIAIEALRPLVDDGDTTTKGAGSIANGMTPELRGQALRLFADLAERTGDLAAAATALEGFASLAVDSSPTARADAMYRAGELFRRADRGDDAIRCLESALRISETHLPALDALEMAWRERGDNERVSVILGRKVAATTRHPARQKPLLSRLGDLQDQLGRPDVALATHQRALEIDPTWRPSLRYVTLRLRDAGQLIAAAGGLAQLAGELPGDTGVDLAIVARERQVAAVALSELVLTLDAKQLDAVAEVARPALERASADGADVAGGLARIRGEVVHVTTITTFAAEEDTASGRASSPSIGALSLKDAAQRARLAGKLDDALATLEAANHVNPGDVAVLQELVELASELGDHAAAARHLTALADLMSGARRGNALLELAELYYDHLDDAARGRQAMRAAAEAFGKGARRDATLRMVASEARANLAWAIAVEALEGIDPARRAASDISDLANALVRSGRDGAALALVEDPDVAAKLGDGGELANTIRASRDRKLAFARALEHEADTARGPSESEANELREAADAIRTSADPRTKTLPGVVADPADDSTSEPRTKTKPGPAEAPSPPSTNTLGRIKLVSVPRPPPPQPIIEIRQSDPEIEIIEETEADDGFQSVTDARIKSGPIAIVVPEEDGFQSLTDPRVKSGPIALPVDLASAPARIEDARGSGLIEPPPETTLRDLPAQTPTLRLFAAVEPTDEPPAADIVRSPAQIVDDESDIALREYDAASPDESPAVTLRGMSRVDDASEGDPPRKPPTLPPLQALRRPAATNPPRTTLREFTAETDSSIPTLDDAPSEAPTPPRTTTPSYASRTPSGPIPTITGTGPIPTITGSGPIPVILEDRPTGRRSSSTIAPPTPTGDRPRAPSVPPPMSPPLPPTVTIQPASRRAPTTPPTVGGLPPVPAPAGRERRPSSLPPMNQASTEASPPPLADARTRTPSSNPVPAGLRKPPSAPPPIAPLPATTLREYTPAVPRDPAVPTREDATTSALLPPSVADVPSLKLSRTTNTALVTVDALAISRASADKLDHPPEPTASQEPSRAATEQIDAPNVTTASLLTDERERLLAAHRETPDDVPTLTALLANLLEAPALRRQVLDAAQRTTHGPALAIVLYELALHARAAQDLIRAAALLSRAHETDPSYAPVWMPLADTLAASDELDAARELYEKVAVSDAYDVRRRAFAQDRADALGKDGTVVSGEIVARPRKSQRSVARNPELDRARVLADADDIKGAIAVAEQIATANADDVAALELLEQLYLRVNDVTGASEAIGRQLKIKDDEIEKAALWRRRAKLYRDSLGRDAEAYRCLKEAHACSPNDPEIAYQLRTAAMVRGEWNLVASLLHREIAAAESPRDRGALHLELALIFDERLDDDAQAQTNFEQALAFDPTIPAAKLPLARRYEMLGRHADAAAMYEEAAVSARAADRAALYEAAARCRSAAIATSAPSRPTPPGEVPLATRVEQAEAAGANDVAIDLAHQLWRAEPGHASAYRVLAANYRTSGDLAALTDITGVRASRAESPEERAAAWISVARLAEDLGTLDQAARAYDLALVEDPGHIEALDARGSLAFRLDDFSTADSIYRDLTPSETLLGIDELALRRSIISEKLGRDSEALTLAQTAAEVAPGRRDLVLRVQELATRIGELDTALAAARSVLDLVPLEDEEGKVRAHFALVELLREAGDLDGAVVQLERVLRDYPIHSRALELLAELHMARGDWQTATRILYQLVPLAPNSQQRAERLYRLGEAVLVHLGDIDRADDVFLRASDLDPSHVPTLRRLLDVYWRADDPGALVEVASELAERGALATGPTAEGSLAHAFVAAALLGDTALAGRLGTALGDDAPRWIASALGELTGRDGRLQLSTASTAIAELARRGLLDLAKVRAAAAAPIASLLATS